MLENLATKSITENILRDLPPFEPDDIIISSATGNEYLVGKTIGEFAENRGLPLSKALLLLMEITGLKAVVIYKNVEEELAAESLFHPNALISTNSSSFSPAENIHKPERSYRTFTKFLELARGRQVIPFEKAIQKITSLPAKLFNLSERGEIREGNFADLVLLKDSWVVATFVNGQLAFENGKLKNSRAGRALRHL
jgi:N-acyl-D-aspartate/D-glutamate deacylase